MKEANNMRGATVSYLESEIERILTKYDTLTRPDLALELRSFDESAVTAALEHLIEDKRVLVEENEGGPKKYRRASNFLTSLLYYGTSTPSGM
ncbi:MAG: hypothetical protein ACE145_05215 [Terriglobia bacterium]